MSGSLTVPNAFAALSGNQPASKLDDNYNAIVNYVNAREITIGVLAARPAAGTAGRYYLATDVAGGTLYVDNGTTWVQAAAAATASKGLLVFSTGATTIPAATSTYLNTTNADTTEGSVSMRMPFAGTFSQMRCNSSNVPGVGQNYTYVLRVAATSTALICTTSGAGSSGSEDTSNSVSFTANQGVTLQLTTSAAANASKHWATLQYDPT